MTSAPTRSTPWPIVVLAILGLILAAPFIFAFLIVGAALTIGLAATLLKAGLVVLALWAGVVLLKRIFGHHDALPTRIETVGRLDPTAELERQDREDREHLAKLDRELELAVAKKNAGTL
jgi:hypothetical protein